MSTRYVKSEGGGNRLRSRVAFTTLGFGDVTLREQWRLIGAFEAATGTIMFGWSTALVFAFIQRAVSVRRSSD